MTIDSRCEAGCFFEVETFQMVCCDGDVMCIKTGKLLLANTNVTGHKFRICHQ